MVKADAGFEAQFRGRVRNFNERDTIAEDVVDPADIAGFRIDRQGRGEKPLVVAVPRPEHQPMFAKVHRS